MGAWGRPAGSARRDSARAASSRASCAGQPTGRSCGPPSGTGGTRHTSHRTRTGAGAATMRSVPSRRSCRGPALRRRLA
jgi:hypothetical protein